MPAHLLASHRPLQDNTLLDLKVSHIIKLFTRIVGLRSNSCPFTQPRWIRMGQVIASRTSPNTTYEHRYFIRKLQLSSQKTLQPAIPRRHSKGILLRDHPSIRSRCSTSSTSANYPSSNASRPSSLYSPASSRDLRQPSPSRRLLPSGSGTYFRRSAS